MQIKNILPISSAPTTTEIAQAKSCSDFYNLIQRSQTHIYYVSNFNNQTTLGFSKLNKTRNGAEIFKQAYNSSLTKLASNNLTSQKAMSCMPISDACGQLENKELFLSTDIEKLSGFTISKLGNTTSIANIFSFSSGNTKSIKVLPLIMKLAISQGVNVLSCYTSLSQILYFPYKFKTVAVTPSSYLPKGRAKDNDGDGVSFMVYDPNNKIANEEDTIIATQNIYQGLNIQSSIIAKYSL